MVSNKEIDNRSRLNEPEQNAVDMERSTEETSGNDEIDDSLSDVSTVDESNVQEVKLSEPPDNVQESYCKYESDAENPEGYHDIGEFSNELNGIYSDGSMSNQEKVDATKECVDKLNHSDLSSEEKKQSVDAPSDARTLKNPENSDWTERTDDNPWPPLNIDSPDKMGLDYDKDISPIGREEGNTQLPDTGFRYDGEGGRYSGDLMNAEEAAKYIEHWRELGIGSDKTWNEFKNANPNATIDDYFKLVNEQSPWPDGYNPKDHMIKLKEGDTFNMVLDKKQKVSQPGGFGIVNDVPNREFARNDMAIKLDWKDDCGKIATYRVKSGKELNVPSGPIGPQIDLKADKYLPGNTGITQLDLFNGLGRINRTDYIEAVPRSVRRLN